MCSIGNMALPKSTRLNCTNEIDFNREKPNCQLKDVTSNEQRVTCLCIRRDPYGLIYKQWHFLKLRHINQALIRDLQFGNHGQR